MRFTLYLYVNNHISSTQENYVSSQLEQFQTDCLWTSILYLYIYIYIYTLTHTHTFPISWDCRIYQLHFCSGVRPPPTKCCPGYDTKQSNGAAPEMLELGECGIPLYCHRSQGHSGSERYHLIGSYLQVK